MRKVFAPGCALAIYKPELAMKLARFLRREHGIVGEHLTCCRHDPGIEAATQIVNVCPGCDRRYRELYENVTTISLWELLAEATDFPFPDYGGQELTIMDACPTRREERVYESIRLLLHRMNIRVVEPAQTKAPGTCSGDAFFGSLPVEDVKAQMRRGAQEMPREDVVVYCVSCIKSMFIGERTPRHMVDLLFGEATLPKTYEPEAWHAELDAFIARH